MTEGSLELAIKDLLSKADKVAQQESERDAKDQESFSKIHNDISGAMQRLESMCYKEVGNVKKFHVNKVNKEQARVVTRFGRPIWSESGSMKDKGGKSG